MATSAKDTSSSKSGQIQLHNFSSSALRAVPAKQRRCVLSGVQVSPFGWHHDQQIRRHPNDYVDFGDGAGEGLLPPCCSIVSPLFRTS